MKIGLSTGYLECYWGKDWFTAKQIGGSERIVVETAAALARMGHEVTVRLPYPGAETGLRGIRWVGLDHPALQFDVLFCFDDFQRRDDGLRRLLVACRSDPPPHADFDQLVFLSRHHAQLMGHGEAPFVGGGVDLDVYAEEAARIPRRVICTSSPDRCPKAAVIGRGFDFKHSYRPVPGFDTTEYGREELVALQKTAQVLIYPLDPVRPSDFFSMAVLEAMAAGTPVIVSDADSMPELWSDAAIVLPRPIRLSEWNMRIEELLSDKLMWQRHHDLGRRLASRYTWDRQAQRYLDLAMEA